MMIHKYLIFFASGLKLLAVNQLDEMMTEIEREFLSRDRKSAILKQEFKAKSSVYIVGWHAMSYIQPEEIDTG
ncbi:hypothetical protein [Psychrobacillus sp. FSL H8-0487]|uniref:hypothetical protein n=1 Tax=Psychrobacillus sp. FSL H8-0487 TaxID=2921391 RepID=UPI0030F579AF